MRTSKKLAVTIHLDPVRLMTRDTPRQFGTLGWRFITKRDHFFLFLLIQKHLMVFEMTPNPPDTTH